MQTFWQWFENVVPSPVRAGVFPPQEENPSQEEPSQEDPQEKDLPTPFDKEGNRDRTGKRFAEFFSNASKGEFQGKGEWAGVMDYSHARPFYDELIQHKGHFDEHIAMSIPTFRETQVHKGHAIVAAFAGTQAKMLDVGGSEGSFAKAVSAMSKGGIQTTVLDPNPTMHDFYKNKSQVSGATYVPKAFYRGWKEDDGTDVPAMNADNTKDRFDIIHEAMVFQFINNQRATHVLEAKRLMAPGGLFITEEKLKTPKEEWDRNELLKDEKYKNIYFTPKELAEKQKVVGFQQDKKEEKSVGMVGNMVTVAEFEGILVKNFREVWQYWDAGNFKGYAASDDPKRVQKFMTAMGNTNNTFSTVKTPRHVKVSMAEQITQFQEWLKEHTDWKSVASKVLPSEDKLQYMASKFIRSEFGPKMKEAGKELGMDLSDEDVEEIFASLLADKKDLPDDDIEDIIKMVNYHM